MISALIVNGNALREVVELLGHVCLNLTMFLTCCFLHCVKSLNFWGCVFELHSVLLYCFFLIWNTHHVVRELLVIITLNFSLVWENYFKTEKTTYFFTYFEHLNTRLTSHKNFLNFSSPTTWTSSNYFFVYELFLKVQKMALWFLFFEQVNPRY